MPKKTRGAARSTCAWTSTARCWSATTSATSSGGSPRRTEARRCAASVAAVAAPIEQHFFRHVPGVRMQADDAQLEMLRRDLDAQRGPLVVVDDDAGLLGRAGRRGRQARYAQVIHL